jgi:hypothetical protein
MGGGVQAVKNAPFEKKSWLEHCVTALFEIKIL